MTSVVKNSGVRRTANAQKIKTVVIDELPTQRAFVGGKGTIWVRDDVPNVLVFTDDAGTDWVLNTAGSPSTLSAVLTAGDDATGLDIDNLGSLTFDTAGPQGINIGTDAGAAVTTAATQIAIGANASIANGDSAIAIGHLASVLADYGIGIGRECLVRAGSNYSVVLGKDANCDGLSTIAVGYNTDSLANQSIAIGYNSQCSAASPDSIAIGQSASNSVGGSAVAIGHQANTNASRAIAIGYDANSGLRSIAIGMYTTTGTGSDNICIGPYCSTPDGSSNVAIGYATNVIGPADQSVCIGYDSTVLNGDNAVCIGASNNVNHTGAIIIGSSMTSSAVNELTLGTVGAYIRTAFSVNAGAIANGIGPALPANAAAVLLVTINGNPYKIPLLSNA